MHEITDQLSSYLQQRDVLHIRCAPPLSDNNGPQLVVLQDPLVWVFAYDIRNLNIRSCHRMYYDYQSRYGKRAVVMVRSVAGLHKCLISRGIKLYDRTMPQCNGLTQYESDVAEIFDECSDNHNDCIECRAIVKCQDYHANLGGDNCPNLTDVKIKLQNLMDKSLQCSLFDLNQYQRRNQPRYHCVKCGKLYNHNKEICPMCGGAVGSYSDHYYTAGRLAKEFSVSRDTINNWGTKGYIEALPGIFKKKKLYTKESVEYFRNQLLPQLIQDGKITPKAHQSKRPKKQSHSHTKKALQNYKCQTCGARYDSREYNNMYRRATNIAKCKQCDGVVVRQQTYTSLRDASMYTGVHYTSLRKLVRDNILPGIIIKQAPNKWYYQFTQRDLDYIKRWHRSKK